MGSRVGIGPTKPSWTKGGFKKIEYALKVQLSFEQHKNSRPKEQGSGEMPWPWPA